MARRRAWILDTETKGTGAEMVPLESVLRKPESRREPLFVPPKRTPRPPREPEPRAPRRFRVIDVMTREVLADDVDARTMLELLARVRSVVDVNLYVWEPASERWRLLTIAEERAAWERRLRQPTG